MFKTPPFDEITSQSNYLKSIPSGHESFVHFLEFLATSPHIDPTFVNQHIIQFLCSTKVKTELIISTYLSLSNLELPESFWNTLLPTMKSSLLPGSPLTESIISCFRSVPIQCILNEFLNLNFLFPFLENEDINIKISTISTLYNFRNSIQLKEEFVDRILNLFSLKSPRLMFMVLNWLIFLNSINFPNIENKILIMENSLLDVIMISGHLINIKQLEFILTYTKPTILQRIKFITHVSISSASFILSTLPNSPDFDLISEISPSIILPYYIEIINNTFSEGIRIELLKSALLIIKSNPTNVDNRDFYNSIVQILFNNIIYDDFPLISLFVSVVEQLNELRSILTLSFKLIKETNFFYKLFTIIACNSSKTGFDITSEILQMLPISDNIPKQYWKLAASASLEYLYNQKEKAISISQSLIEIIPNFPDYEIKCLYYIIISTFIPIQLKKKLINCIKILLLPNKFLKPNFNYLFRNNTNLYPDLSLTLKIPLIISLYQISNFEEIEDISELLNDPLLINFKNYQSLNKLLISPYYICSSIDIGDLAYALQYPLNQFLTFNKERSFQRISPDNHSINVEISSNVNYFTRSFSFDLRISSKNSIPLNVSLEVPDSFTPPLVSDWLISNLSSNINVTRKYSFTANKLNSTFINLIIKQENSIVLNLKICIPLIDMFNQINNSNHLTDIIFEKLSFEKNNINIENKTFVSYLGCISIKNNIARADKIEFLDMLSSYSQISAII